MPIDIELDALEPPPEPAPEPPPRKIVCAWERTKGVAEVVGLKDAEAEFRFYPGDIPVGLPEDHGFDRGREFKAVLMRANGCDTRLEVIDAVP